MKPLLACVTGLDGAGKSTVVDELAARLRAGGRSVAVATIWDAILDPEFAGRALFERPSQADGYLRLLESTSRMLFLAHGLQESLARALARRPDVVLLNAYWYKYYATEVAHGGDPARLRQVTSVFPEPDATFYLRVGIAEAARRKGRFSAYETGFAPEPSAAAFEAFQAPALRELDALARELGWVHVANEGAGASAAADGILAELGRLAPAASAPGDLR